MAKAHQKNSVRIIAGQWKGRRIEFIDAQGLRPTKDFIRETLFNWLSDDIVASYCLDLFAGSGALSFEAASRGAASVVAVESNINTFSCLLGQVEKISAETIEIVNLKAEQFVGGYDGRPFDVVFLDPPFDLFLDDAFFYALRERNIVKAGTKIYFEQPNKVERSVDLTAYSLLREKKSGQVSYRLYEY